MPVVRRKPDSPDLTRYQPLITALATELTRTDGIGQPMIEEQELPRSGMFEANVFWDRWAEVPDRDRPAVIRQAYRQGRPADLDQLAFASGYTIAEALEADLLPYIVQPSNRPGTIADAMRLWPAMSELSGISCKDDQETPFVPCRTYEEAVRCKEAITTNLGLQPRALAIRDRRGIRLD